MRPLLYSVCVSAWVFLAAWMPSSPVEMPRKRTAIDLDSLPAGSRLVSMLDSTYTSAVHVDSTQAFFRSSDVQEKWVSRWQQMLFDIGDSLQHQGLKWNTRVRVFTRTYFNPTGSIDYFLYSIKQAASNYPSPAMRDSMRGVFQRFAASYKLDSTIGAPVVQCGPMILAPAD